MKRGGISRRLFLGGTSVIALSGIAAAAPPYPWRPNSADAPDGVAGRDYQFFQPEEAAFIEAAVDRLVPSDDVGPGAKDAGVALFIDRQLAGPYGQGDHTFLQAPFRPGEPTQGWQMRAPAIVYRAAIPEIDAYSRASAGAAFASLSEVDQDRVLGQLESGDAKFNGDIAAKAFFALLLQNTIEGYFADPLYGGNRNMAAWRMIGFPGARYDYRLELDRPGERLTLEPIGTGRTER